LSHFNGQHGTAFGFDAGGLVLFGGGLGSIYLPVRDSRSLPLTPLAYIWPARVTRPIACPPSNICSIDRM